MFAATLADPADAVDTTADVSEPSAPGNPALDMLAYSVETKNWESASRTLDAYLDLGAITNTDRERLAGILYETHWPNEFDEASLLLKHRAHSLMHRLHSWAPPRRRASYWRLLSLIEDANSLGMLGRTAEAEPVFREAAAFARDLDSDAARSMLVHALSHLAYDHADVFDDLLRVHPLVVGLERDHVVDALLRVLERECGPMARLGVSFGSEPVETLETGVAHCDAALASLRAYPSKRSDDAMVAIGKLRDPAASRLQAGAFGAAKTAQQRGEILPATLGSPPAPQPPEETWERRAVVVPMTRWQSEDSVIDIVRALDYIWASELADKVEIDGWKYDGDRTKFGLETFKGDRLRWVEKGLLHRHLRWKEMTVPLKRQLS